MSGNFKPKTRSPIRPVLATTKQTSSPKAKAPVSILTEIFLCFGEEEFFDISANKGS